MRFPRRIEYRSFFKKKKHHPGQKRKKRRFSEAAEKGRGAKTRDGSARAYLASVRVTARLSCVMRVYIYIVVVKVSARKKGYAAESRGVNEQLSAKTKKKNVYIYIIECTILLYSIRRLERPARRVFAGYYLRVVIRCPWLGAT